MKSKVQDFLVTVSAFGILIMLVVSGVTIGGKILFPNRPVSLIGEEYDWSEIIVQPGDTLWSIATSEVPSRDPRDVVGSMRDINDLESADIFPGQVLTVQVTQPKQPYQVADGRVR